MDANADEIDNKIRIARWHGLFHRAHEVTYSNELVYDRRTVSGDELWRKES